jgi:hypothetical protein
VYLHSPTETLPAITEEKTLTSGQQVMIIAALASTFTLFIVLCTAQAILPAFCKKPPPPPRQKNPRNAILTSIPDQKKQEDRTDGQSGTDPGYTALSGGAAEKDATIPQVTNSRKSLMKRIFRSSQRS